jgi:Cd(II)/Pb(II)-responsive transcriptional regulator
MRIGELARKAGSQPETVRYYERLGLLPQPERTGGNYRIYSEEHLERLRFIRNCRSIGMTLEEVRRLLYFRDRPRLACHEINQLLDTHIEHLGEQLRDLHRLEEYLHELRACCESPRTAGDCGILARLDRVEASQPPCADTPAVGMVSRAEPVLAAGPDAE